jgi:hypothetical protein
MVPEPEALIVVVAPLHNNVDAALMEGTGGVLSVYKEILLLCALLQLLEATT